MTISRCVKCTALAAAVTMGWACAEQLPEPDPLAAGLAEWPVSATPTLSIGVVEGDPAYQLFRARSAARVGDLIVVANAGTRELRYYDATGRFLHRAGGYGEGPGEFRVLDAVYAAGGDSVLALHDGGGRSWFGRDGVHLGTELRERGSRTRFAADWWLYRKSLVVHAPDGPIRAHAADAIDRLPDPPFPPGYWYVRWDDAGAVWVSDGPDPDGGRSRWTVVDTSGVPVARVRLPPRFELYEVTEHDLLGRWRDEFDVEHIRVYSLDRRPPAGPRPSTFAATDRGDSSAGVTDASALLDMFGSVLREAVTAQEAYFADHRRYTGNRFELHLEVPEGAVLDFIGASPSGWLGVLSHRDAPVVCAIGLGAATPPGWREGVPVCADEEHVDGGRS